MTKALPYDIFFEILSWLPAKAVHRLKSSSKLFLEIAEDTYFALKQTQKALIKDDTCFFIQDVCKRYNGYTELRPLYGEELSSGVPKDVIAFLSNCSKIIASSNGLILCRTTYPNEDVLFVSNPATNSSIRIPISMEESDSECADLNIVLLCNSSDFMVCLFYDPFEWSSYLACKVYSQKEGTWRTNEANFFAGGRRLRFDLPVHYNGAIHLISDCSPYLRKDSPYYRPYILSYNHENGESRFLRVPKEAKRGSDDISCDMRIFKWDKATSLTQSICLVRLRKKVFTIWVLTNYESSLWRRILKVRVKRMGLPELEPVVTGFTVLNGDILVFATQKKVYSYGLTGERNMILREICEHGCQSQVSFVSYSNTLRSCGVNASHLTAEFVATIPSF